MLTAPFKSATITLQSGALVVCSVWHAITPGTSAHLVNMAKSRKLNDQKQQKHANLAPIAANVKKHRSHENGYHPIISFLMIPLVGPDTLFLPREAR